MPPLRGLANVGRAGYKDAAPSGAWRHQRHPPLLRQRRAVLETILNRSISEKNFQV